MDKEALISSAIAKKLDGQATADELELFRVWLDADPANKAEYARLEKLWTSIGSTLPADNLFDTDAAWKKVDPLQPAAISRSLKQGIVTTMFRKRLAIAAAVIIFMVGLFGVTYNWSNDTVVAATGNNQLIQLPDQSTVLLRAGSSLKYPKQFYANTREVELTGEGFFQVVHNVKQPFLVHTGHATITVLGTSFLVRSANKTDEVVVVTGKVRVADRQHTENEVLLVAGQQAKLTNDVFQQSAVKDSNYIAWKNGVLDFKSASLEKVLDDISHYYQTPIELASPGTAPGKILITVHFENQPLDAVLEEIRIITGLDTKKESGKTLFYQK